MGSRKFHSRNLHIHRAFIGNRLRQGYRHVKFVNILFANCVPDVLTHNGIFIIFTEVYFFGKAFDTVGCCRLQLVCIGNSRVGYQVVDTPIAEQVFHNIVVAFRVV